VKRIGLLMAMVAAFSAPSVHAVVDLNGNGMSDVWEQFYQAQGLAANADADGDGQTNLAESIAGTNPFDSQSVTRISGITISGGAVTLSWGSVAGQMFQVQSSANLTSWQNLGTPFTGTTGTA